MLLRDLQLVRSGAAYLVMVAVVAIDAWLLYRFFARERMPVVTCAT